MAWVRRELPIALFGFISLLLIIAFYSDFKPLLDISNRIMQIGSVAAAFALILGALNLIRTHSRIISRRTRGLWMWSVYVLVLFIPLTIYGVIMGPSDSGYNWVYQNVYTPLTASMWGLLAPYIATASFRAFRLRNIESVIVTASCVGVLLMNAPIGGALWPGFPIIGQWITDHIQTTGVRVFAIGVAVGLIALYIRTLLGRETASLGFGGER